MHYRNGRPAMAGDRVVDTNTGELLVIESISGLSPTCNAVCHQATPLGLWKTVGDLLRADDAQAILSKISPPAAPETAPS